MKEEGSRAIGYCMNEKCGHLHKATFMLMRGETTQFKCPACTKRGLVKRSTMERKDDGYDFFRSVVLHFSYSPDKGKYTEQAIVELNEAVGGNRLVIEDPLITTERRALKVAEMRLGAVNAGYHGIDDQYDMRIIRLDVPMEQLKEELAALEKHGVTVRRRVYGR